MLEPHYAGVPRECLPELPRNPVHLVLDNLRSAYNVGAIFRTCDAGAVAHLYLCGVTPHPPNEKLAKTALGAFDYLSWSYHQQVEEPLERLGLAGVPVIAIENGPGAVSYCRYQWPRPVALVVGNEVEGVSGPALEASLERVQIPVLGYKRSLNVANALGIVLFEILRQWGAV